MPYLPAFVSLLLLALLPGVAPQCHVAVAGECLKHTAPVPGYSLVGQGFDITTLKPTGASLVDINWWTYPNGSCTLCHNPALEGQLQQLPLAVVDWQAQDPCLETNESAVKLSPLEVAQWASTAVQNDWTVGLEVDVQAAPDTQVVLAGSRSRMAEISSEKARQDKYAFIGREVSCQYYQWWLLLHPSHPPPQLRFRLAQNPPLSLDFSQALSDLPDNYGLSSREDYLRFLGIYGTHYLALVHVGGHHQEIKAVPVCRVALDGLTVDQVRDCLDVEVEAGLGGGQAKVDSIYAVCEKTKAALAKSFHQVYTESHVEATGGHHHVDFLLQGGRGSGAYARWVEGLKANPGLISYTLMPIHALARKGDPRRASLQRAVSQYVLDGALWRNCTHPCPLGTQRSPWDPCTCLCSEEVGWDASCCSRERSLGQLMVTVVNASRLYGDLGTQSDAYVKVFYGGQELRADTVWNNDSPAWGVGLDFGVGRVDGEDGLRLEVWDEDNGHDDDLLGACGEMPVAGAPQSRTCYLAYGQLHFLYRLQCGPGLGGPRCQDYAPRPPEI
ncbi:perforin-1 [Alligator mississippiensis]|uniref:perforin-1 n=1 Tax=Alligator mississippiensis TaxID=8496 RepID=UPI002878085A|nr:perforin-1 [Alligator mississippiensis]